MKIEQLTLREIRMPLLHPFETSFGRTTERRILLVTAICDGVEGWGECTAGEGPLYCEESTDTAWYVIATHFVPILLGRTLARAITAFSGAHTRASHGQGRPGKRLVGRRGAAGEPAFVGAAGRHAPPDSLRRFHRHSDFD